MTTQPSFSFPDTEEDVFTFVRKDDRSVRYEGLTATEAAAAGLTSVRHYAFKEGDGIVKDGAIPYIMRYLNRDHVNIEFPKIDGVVRWKVTEKE